MSHDPPPPCFSDAEILKRLRSAARRGLTQTRQGENDLFKYGYDIQGASELIAECSDAELSDHEPSDHYPKFNDYIVILKVDLQGERRPFYVKVALHLPALETGELLSFHEWGLQR